MRIFVALVYLLAALGAGSRAMYIWLDGLNGRPWSWWIILLLAGATVLLVAGGLTIVDRSNWGNRLAVVGSVMLAGFYAPALSQTLRHYVSSTPDGYDPVKVGRVLAEPLLLVISLTLSSRLLIRGGRRRPLPTRASALYPR